MDKKVFENESEKVLELKRGFAKQRDSKYKTAKEEFNTNCQTLKELEERAKKSEMYIQRAAKGKATRVKNLEKAIHDFEMKDEANTTEEDRRKAFKNYLEYTRKTAPNYKPKSKRTKKSHAEIYEETKKQIEEIKEKISISQYEVAIYEYGLSNEDKMIRMLNEAYERVVSGEEWNTVKVDIFAKKAKMQKEQLNSEEIMDKINKNKQQEESKKEEKSEQQSATQKETEKDESQKQNESISGNETKIQQQSITEKKTSLFGRIIASISKSGSKLKQNLKRLFQPIIDKRRYRGYHRYDMYDTSNFTMWVNPGDLKKNIEYDLGDLQNRKTKTEDDKSDFIFELPEEFKKREKAEKPEFYFGTPQKTTIEDVER